MSKEEIFKKHFEKVSGKIADEMVLHHMNYVLNAMQEYTDQQTKPLIDEIEELKSRIDELESELKFAKSQNRNYLSFLKQRNELKNENIKLQSRIDELEKANEWISVEDRLPDEDISVFCYTNVGGRCTCFYKNGNWRYQHNSGLIDTILNITHWMPLPNNPKTN